MISGIKQKVDHEDPDFVMNVRNSNEDIKILKTLSFDEDDLD